MNVCQCLYPTELDKILVDKSLIYLCSEYLSFPGTGFLNLETIVTTLAAAAGIIIES